MSEATQTSAMASTVPVDVRQSLLVDGADVQTKVGHVAKFSQDGDNSNLDENIALEELDDFQKPKGNNEFVGLTKEVYFIADEKTLFTRKNFIFSRN